MFLTETIQVVLNDDCQWWFLGIVHVSLSISLSEIVCEEFLRVNSILFLTIGSFEKWFRWFLEKLLPTIIQKSSFLRIFVSIISWNEYVQKSFSEVLWECCLRWLLESFLAKMLLTYVVWNVIASNHSKIIFWKSLSRIVFEMNVLEGCLRVSLEENC